MKYLKLKVNFYIKNLYINMYKINLFLIIFLSLISYNAFPQVVTQVSSDQQVTPAMLLEYEYKLEQQRAEYVQKNILDKIFGPNKSTVMVDVTLGLRTTTTKQQATAKKLDAKRKLGEAEFLLPGIPKPGSIAESAVPTETKGEASGTEVIGVRTEIVIEKQTVTVVYDERIKSDKIDLAREAIAAALGIKRPQDIIFKKAKFTTSLWNRFIENILLPKYLIPLVITLLILMFLFGPVAAFLRSYINMLRERSPTEISIDSKLTKEAEAETVGSATSSPVPTKEEMEEMEEEKKEEGKYIPFSYINDENIKRLIYLLAKEKPEDIAIVLSYLKPEYTKQVIESFKPELQAQVALALAQAREIPQEDVVRMDSYVKERIDFLVGGIYQLVELLKKVDTTTRNSILAYLENKKPEIYEKVRPQLFLFEDILDLPDIALQTVIRELKPENLARALRNAPKKLVDKFFRNMSEGAQALVREEIEYGRPVSKEQVEEEQNKIVELIKKLAKEGKIYLEEKEEKFSVDASEVEVVSSKKETSQDFAGYDYFTEALNFYQIGDIDTAISYLQYAIQLNPKFYEAYQYLGNIYYEIGQYLEALECYKKAVDLNPQNKELADWVAEFEKNISNFQKV